MEAHAADDLPVNAKRILDYLRWFDIKFDEVFLKASTIAQKLALSVRTVMRHLAVLRALALLGSTRTGRASVYKVAACVASWVWKRRAYPSKNPLSHQCHIAVTSPSTYLESCKSGEFRSPPYPPTGGEVITSIAQIRNPFAKGRCRR